jgi:putative ABC transport system permease protein
MEIRPILSSLLRNKTGALLIAAQVALTLAIVSNALYIVRDRMQLASRPTGVADEASYFRIITTRLDKSGDHFAEQKRDEEALRAVPGVVSASWSNQSPLGRSGWNMGLQTTREQTNSNINGAFYMSPNPVVQTYAVTLVEGRDFTPQDVVEWDAEASNTFGHTAIVTQALAKRLYPDSSAVGKVMYVGDGADAIELRIVGVIERLQSPWAQVKDENAESAFLTATRLGDNFGNYIIRTEPGQVDRVMRDAEAALLKVESRRLIHGKRTLVEDRANRYRDDKAVAWMLVTVTTLLLLVTASGIIGMATLWVNQRRKQIGVRRALGARRADILRYFLVENFLISTGGIVAGLLLAIGLNQLLVSRLELARLPLGYVAIGAAVLWLLGLVAVYGPAWRAAGIAPAIATRSA